MSDGVPAATQEEQNLRLHVERATVQRVTRETGSVQVEVATRHHDHVVDAMLSRTDVAVEHVPIGIFVDAAPPVREEGDTLVIPIVEEVVVTRLRLREEVRVTRTTSTRHHQDTVSLRREEATVTRTSGMPAPDPADPDGPTTRTFQHGQ